MLAGSIPKKLKAGGTYSVKPVSVEKRLAATAWRLGSPLATESALGILPLGLNASLEAVKVRAGNQLARLQHVVIHAVHTHTHTMS